jgi:mannose-1-phosphate guanylyltransferase
MSMTARPDDRTGRGISVIMAGGRGTRFWPLSRLRRPKQLLPLGTGDSLLRDTWDRVVSVSGPERILVITHASQADAVRAALPELPADHVVAEPCGRNTAPCAALGAALAARLDATAPVALLPADHLIPQAEVFREQFERAFADAAAQGGVGTFGILPDHPATGYGYIETAAGPTADVLVGRRFVEKPALAAARDYAASGRHYWNGGIFVWGGDALRGELARRIPAVVARIEPAAAAWGAARFDAELAAAYADCPAESIDYAVMEHLRDFRVYPARFGWSDLGSWDAWGEQAQDLGDGNRGRVKRLLTPASKGHIVYAPDKTVALVGVDDLIVVDTDDALLICRKDAAQDVKRVTDLLGRDETTDLL